MMRTLLPQLNLSYVEQLNRDSMLLPGLSCYDEVDRLRLRSRRIYKALSISASVRHPDKWVIWGVFYRFKLPYYWLVNIVNGKFSSYSVKADSVKMSKFTHRIIDIQNGWVDQLAAAEDVLPFIRKEKELHFTSVKHHRSWERTNGKWLTIPKHLHPKLHAELPLGKLYRAIDIGSIVPVFKTEDALIGLGVRYR
jgi:hypothetical protein